VALELPRRSRGAGSTTGFFTGHGGPSTASRFRSRCASRARSAPPLTLELGTSTPPTVSGRVVALRGRAGGHDLDRSPCRAAIGGGGRRSSLRGPLTLVRFATQVHPRTQHASTLEGGIRTGPWPAARALTGAASRPARSQCLSLPRPAGPGIRGDRQLIGGNGRSRRAPDPQPHGRRRAGSRGIPWEVQGALVPAARRKRRAPGARGTFVERAARRQARAPRLCPAAAQARATLFTAFARRKFTVRRHRRHVVSTAADS